MILITLVLMAAFLATAILVEPLEALHPKAEEIILLEMVESLEGATGDLRNHLNARLGGIDKLTRLDCGIQLSPTVFTLSSECYLLFSASLVGLLSFA
jgi:hypothetical protein